jgi:hypothetical protein
MADKRKIPADHGDKDKEVTVDLKTARRILKWVNAANRPENLMQPPAVLTHLHVEYRKPAFPERHPPADEEHDQHDESDKQEKRANEKLAIEVLNLRNERSNDGSVRNLAENARRCWVGLLRPGLANGRLASRPPCPVTLTSHQESSRL